MDFSLEEPTIRDLQAAMSDGEITSRQLTLAFLSRIAELDKAGPKLHAVIELNPEAVFIAQQLDAERSMNRVRGPLHGIPILLKDNINTGDAMHTSAGSLALADSYAPSDAELVKRLRQAGAVILGKTNMTEWANFMSEGMKNGYSSRGGQTLNPYGPGTLDAGGSSTGSAVAVAANFCAAAIGTETSGSILNPACRNHIVGIKPTLGLISRSGIIPITYTQDTAGPLARSVEDAAILLGILAGSDPRDEATLAASACEDIPQDYTPFLKEDGLMGKRIGVNRAYIEELDEEERRMLDGTLEKMREAGAEIIEGTDLPHISEDATVLLYEFKSALNRYLSQLGPQAVRKTLSDIITFNLQHSDEALRYGQTWLERAEQETSGTLTEAAYWRARQRDWKAAREDGIDRLIAEHQLDVILCPGVTDSPAVAGYPAIMIPVGVREDGMPFGISLTASAYSEPLLIEAAYALEQLLPSRRPPVLHTGEDN
ncbi:amidase family protein [Paenibacillus sp. JX-17]|uniref:Amidase family protein n=1 Tax=Paenibacillus lacisoli TaxID=3064525 RepID=A0ABT9CCH7_9BACL|nr:amidase family protein [Paenibacillus sp. JX-17]MDO7905682.1 amidase family protein [Paenibacillus sp. JX-17]